MQADFSNISLAGPDDYARAAAMRDPNRRDRLANALAYYIPPELGGWMELFDYINPVSDVGRAMQSSQNMLAPDRTAWERLGAFGSMATDIASVVAPAAAVRLAGGDAGRGVVEALANATMPADDALTRFAAADDGAIRAWHGSPHDFDRFSMDKIGTGEGAQAYGHGLYFAESEDVARGYRDKLAPQVYGARALNSNGGDLAAAIDEAKKRVAHYEAMEPGRYRDGLLSINKAKLADLEARAAGQEPIAGRLYEVNINANPEDFLDWDRPLSEQPQVLSRLGLSTRSQEEISDEATRLFEEGNARAGRAGGWMDYPDIKARIDQLNDELDRRAPNITGQEYYRGGADGDVSNILSQMGYGNPVDQSRVLREAGIPGIRYLDAGSRGAGDGSRNYVVFDENLIEIVKKYGIAGAAAIYGVNEADIQSAMPGGI